MKRTKHPTGYLGHSISASSSSYQQQPPASKQSHPRWRQRHNHKDSLPEDGRAWFGLSARRQRCARALLCAVDGLIRAFPAAPMRSRAHLQRRWIRSATTSGPGWEPGARQPEQRASLTAAECRRRASRCALSVSFSSQ